MEGENNGDSLSAGVETHASPEAETNKVATQSLEKCFVQVQGILDQNRLLINEINRNHQSGELDNLGRNVALIRELNTNISCVVEFYEDLSLSFPKSVSGKLVSLSQRSKACQKKGNSVHLSQGSEAC
ncbi:ELF4-like protein [Rhynchospora pubera]|uniref:ELF4-like protein n=1 Tax=Rhynchospora pubera TaxID=906938 RepID=A0AAV8H4Y9_9POAL|nr:ELF4-like protein [Rhynchospora pubera]